MLDFEIEQKSVWEELKNTCEPIIMYGTGNGADKVFEIFEKLDIKVSGITASNSFVRERYFHGFKVTPVSDFFEKYKNFTIVITFGSQISEVIDNIKELSQKQRVLVPCVPVIENEIFDRDFLEKNEENLNKAYSVLADEKSKEVFKNYVNFEFSGKLQYLFQMESTIDEAYINCLKLSNNEAFIDIGAYRGDTVNQFLHFTDNRYSFITAVEPDEKTFKKLILNTEKLENFKAVNSAVSDIDGEISFSSLAGRQSTIGEGKTISSVTLNSLSNEHIPSFIKIDSEGAEMRILKGGEDILKAHKPKLKIAAYHKNRDIFEIPLFLKSINPDYKIFMRHHPYIPAWDTDFYCV